MCILSDLNRYIGDRIRACITVAFEVPGENDNGRRSLEFCSERGLCVGNTYFKHRSLCKYTRVARGHGGVEIKSMRSNVGEEGYAAICAGCEGNERDGKRTLRSLCSTL